MADKRRYLLAALLAIALLALSAVVPSPASGQSEEPTTTTTILDPKFRVPLPPTVTAGPPRTISTAPLVTLPLTGADTDVLISSALALLAVGVLLILPVFRSDSLHEAPPPCVTKRDLYGAPQLR